MTITPPVKVQVRMLFYVEFEWIQGVHGIVSDEEEIHTDYGSDEENMQGHSSDDQAIPQNQPAGRVFWGPVRGNHKKIVQFSGSPGITPHVAAMLIDGEPGDYFDAIVDDIVIRLIVDQTNLYATQLVMSNDTQPNSRLHQWIPTTTAEIKRFLAIVAYMGMVKLPSLADYWSNDELFGIQFTRNVMSRNRFEILLRMIHFADNMNPVPDDKLYKIRPLLDALLHNFKQLYVPEEYVCIDETMLPFRGRLGIRQYNKQKRHKYGVKLFKLCSGLGYTYNVRIYAGKEFDKTITPAEIVMLLSNDLLHQGRTVVTDNWYTSLQLANQLLEADTHFVGTIRKNRKGIPKEVAKKN